MEALAAVTPKIPGPGLSGKVRGRSGRRSRRPEGLPEAGFGRRESLARRLLCGLGQAAPPVPLYPHAKMELAPLWVPSSSGYKWQLLQNFSGTESWDPGPGTGISPSRT